MKVAGLLIVSAMVLAACGGSPSRVERASAPKVYSSGPILSACMRADRKAASRQLCGCVQAVADDMLSSSDQSLAVKFFADPHHAQEIRQSDRRSHEIFWDKYKAFSRSAVQRCS
ncbi:MAG: hypothetical protein AAGP08_04790 [Pseudomonadota bacterium]